MNVCWRVVGLLYILHHPPNPPNPRGEQEPEIALPLNQGENRNQKLASPKDKSSSFHSSKNKCFSFHSPLNKGGWAGKGGWGDQQRFSGKR